MVKKESEWLFPEKLRKQEQRERKEVENGTFSGKGHFGSYYAYSKGINYDFIKHHAVSDDQGALKYVKHISIMLEKCNLKLEGNILDVGCAIGTITNVIGQLNKNGNTYGLDISQDSIEVAKKKYPNCSFFCQSADNLDNFDDEYFDVIHVREFYPFSRTNDYNFHLKYLRLFHSKLKPYGFVLLQMVSSDKGFCNTYKKIAKELKDIGYSTIKREALIANSFFNILGNLAHNRFSYPILLLTTKMLFWIARRERVSCIYFLTKK